MLQSRAGAGTAFGSGQNMACLLITPFLHARRSPTCKMVVDAVESTPNPSAFLLRLDAPIEGTAATGLRGQTYSHGSRGNCPPALQAALSTKGVESLFVCGDMLTLSKAPSVAWDQVLPLVIETLGGASESLSAAGLPSGGSTDLAPSSIGGVQIRLQVSQKLPIQVEAVGWLGANQPLRAKLSPRFGSAMGLLIGQSGDAFFTAREWMERGMRYPEVDLDPDDPIGSERRAMAASLEAELAEVEAAYPDDRIAALIFGHKSSAREAGEPVGADTRGSLLSLADVDQLCDEDMACTSSGEAGLNDALRRLAAFVANGNGVMGARRNAIAYLGGTAERGGDVVFDAVGVAFKSEKAAGLRRTAGDALSDLGNGRAAPLAVAALTDRSTLVRWRAARILGEVGEGGSVAAALKQASLEEAAFEVAFEMKDAARKVASRDAGEGGAKGPMWKQIQDGLA
jgi:hypothetical protein